MSQLTKLKEQIMREFGLQPKVILFASYSNGAERGVTVHTQWLPLEHAWKQVEDHLQQIPEMDKKYLRIDYVTDVEELSYEEAVDQLVQVERNNYFRRGIAFHDDFRVAFLPEEIQGNALVKPVKGHKVGYDKARLRFDNHNLSGYLYRMTGKDVNFDTAAFKKIYFFDTQGYYLENENWLRLSTEELHVGMRQYDFGDLLAKTPITIKNGRDFLVNQQHEDGSFTYGLYPTYDAIIKGYNTIRHLSSLYAWLEIEAYDPLPDSQEKIHTGIQWALANMSISVEDCLVMIERTGDLDWPSKSTRLPKDFRIKLGAQAMSLLAMSKYMELYDSDEYVDHVRRIANTMEKYFIDQEGNTVHILNSDFSLQKEFEIVYYDGEAVFGLLRAYSITKNPEHLILAERLYNRLIEKGYQKYHDHWLSYATNEILLYRNEVKYYKFGLANALDNIRFIENRDTAYPTMLEMLMAAVKMTDKLAQQDFAKELVEESDVVRLKQAAMKRALHEINTGVMHPEIAMFMKRPDKVVGGFMTRHDRFRMRIDDEEHYLSGLVNFAEYFFGEK